MEKGLAIGLGLGLGLGSVIAYTYFQKQNEDKKTTRRIPTSANLTYSSDIKPPMPDDVVKLLDSTSLCYLSTSGDDREPHLSLMNFTYVRGEELIIMSSRRDTRKLANILASPKVAILVHNFPQVRSGQRSTDSLSRSSSEAESCTYSITLYGTTSVAEGEDAEHYRQLHLQHNPGSSQFILGQNYAIVLVKVSSASICNNQDKVRNWTADPSGK
eukprot:gb/GEZN01014778.1/.p1 GENE.gb/GEZN01014778.1/~~gb/GEZN01014778.1/.p1  ORF type:complete len:215 (-),score=16.41 gb/GEZN01014778.1/:185-829(-)